MSKAIKRSPSKKGEYGMKVSPEAAYNFNELHSSEFEVNTGKALSNVSEATNGRIQEISYERVGTLDRSHFETVSGLSQRIYALRTRSGKSTAPEHALLQNDDEARPQTRVFHTWAVRRHGASATKSVTLAEWEGRVESVSEQNCEFEARIWNVKENNKDELEEAIFDIDAVSESDLPLLQEGAIFRFMVVREDRPSGRQNVSKLIFRRLPAKTHSVKTKASEWAKTISAAINQNDIDDVISTSIE